MQYYSNIFIYQIYVMHKMKSIYFPCLMALLLLAGCSSADSKIPAIATDMCDCFEEMKKNMSPAAITVFEKVKISAAPQKTLQEEIRKLSPDDAKGVAAQMTAIGKPSSGIAACMQAIDKKYGNETTADKNALLKKVMTEMATRQNCTVGAAIINIGASKVK
jgi:hypothetical protein